MHLADIVPIRVLVGIMTKLLEFEALDLAKVPWIPLAIIGMHFAAGRTAVNILNEDHSSGGCA